MNLIKNIINDNLTTRQFVLLAITIFCLGYVLNALLGFQFNR